MGTAEKGLCPRWMRPPLREERLKRVALHSERGGDENSLRKRGVIDLKMGEKRSGSRGTRRGLTDWGTKKGELFILKDM